jgi:hypothetical protein
VLELSSVSMNVIHNVVLFGRGVVLSFGNLIYPLSLSFLTFPFAIMYSDEMNIFLAFSR